MRFLRTWISILTFLAFSFTSIHQADAREFCTSAGGAAYEEAYQSCCIAPAIAFALLALAGIIAVGVHNRSHSSHDGQDAH